MLDVRGLTVGPVQENCYLVRPQGSDTAVIVDPGEEPERLLAALQDAGITHVAAILITHCHFDHVGAVAAMHRATGAAVYVPVLEKDVLANINDYVRYPGFGPFEPYVADVTVDAGDVLELAGLTLDVRFTPGHSPGHVTYAVRGEDALFSGDVLFAGSVGRVDLPGGDWPTLLKSIESLISEFGDTAQVYPGHMGTTTLGSERASNPFLQELTSP